MVKDEWPWYVRMYYADDHPKAGQLALETKHRTEDSMRLEIQVAHRNDDIDVVEYGTRHRII